MVILKNFIFTIFLCFSLHSLPSYAVKKLSNYEIEKLKSLAESDAKTAKKLGFMFFKGIGVQKNKIIGLQYLEQAAVLGDKKILNFLIKSYSKKTSPFYNPEKLKLLLALRDEESETTFERLPKDKNYFLGWKNESVNINKISGHGSGFALNNKGFFLTNEHVVNGCKRVLVNYNGFLNFARKVKMDENYDLAVLKVDGLTPYYLSLSKRVGIIGESVTVAGYPQLTFKLSEGIIASIISEESRKLIQVSASISSGNSGGPVIDNNGNLLGVATEKDEPGAFTDKSGNTSVFGDDFNYAVANSSVKKFLDNSNIRYKVNKNKSRTFNLMQLGEILKKTSSVVLCYEG